jgi:hypothetical protein
MRDIAKENTPLFYSDVFEHLDLGNVAYVVVGSIAVVLHGYVRPIYDLDIVVNSSPEDANRALRVLMLAGFAPTLPLQLHLVNVMRMFDQSGRELDVFPRYHIPFAELWSNSVKLRVGNGMACVASLDHLLHAKRTTARPHDLMDVEGLLAIKH